MLEAFSWLQKNDHTVVYLKKEEDPRLAVWVLVYVMQIDDRRGLTYAAKIALRRADIAFTPWVTSYA